MRKPKTKTIRQSQGDRSRLTLRLPTLKVESLRWVAAANGISVTELIEKFIDKGLK